MPFLPASLAEIVPENAPDLKPLASIRPIAPDFLVQSVLFSPDRTRLALQFVFYGSRDRDREAYIEMWSLENGQRLFETLHWKYPATMFFLPGGEFLVIPADAHRAHVLNEATGAEESSFLVPSHDNVITLASDGTILALGEHGEEFGAIDTIHLFDLTTQEEVEYLKVPGDLISVTSFGSYLAAISVSTQLTTYTYLFDLTSQKEIKMTTGAGTFPGNVPLLEYRQDETIKLLDV